MSTHVPQFVRLAATDSGRHFMADKLKDGRAAESVITRSKADWTIVRPPRLLDSTENKGYRLETGAKPSPTGSLPYRDLACLLDLSEGKSHVGEIVGVASL